MINFIKVSIIYNKKNNKFEKIIINKLLFFLKLNKNIKIVNFSPDLVIFIGGDGTMLMAFKKFEYCLNKIQFLGINTGHLGFYTDWSNFEIKKLVDNLNLNNIKKKSISYSLLEMNIFFRNNTLKKFLILNESIIKNNINDILLVDIYIGKQFFEKFKGDSLIFSTQIGSTAYNKNVGGAIISPKINAFQFIEIAPINNIYFNTIKSPILISDFECVYIKFNNNNNKYFISYDNKQYFNLYNIDYIKYKISNKRINFFSINHKNFWKRVRNSFIKY